MHKTILCYGDSNLRGFIPGPIDIKTGLAERYTKNKRWTGIMQSKLGKDYDVIEEGMGGRTTVLDEIVPGRPYRNGLTYLPFCLESHYPIDLVIFMLGTNDTKLQFNKSPEEIAKGMTQLITVVKNCNKGVKASAPNILLIVPQPIISVENLHPEFQGDPIAKSEALASLYQRIAQEENCEFLDSSHVVTSSKIDGVHLDESQCELLGHAVAEKVLQILG
jgi:lysophospholipase L1-like esterase